jgi:hypothetical protein
LDLVFEPKRKALLVESVPLLQDEGLVEVEGNFLNCRLDKQEEAERLCVEVTISALRDD